MFLLFDRTCGSDGRIVVRVKRTFRTLCNGIAAGTLAVVQAGVRLEHVFVIIEAVDMCKNSSLYGGQGDKGFVYEWKCCLFDVFANVFVDDFLFFLIDCILKLFLVCFSDSVPFCGLDAWNASAKET